MILTCHTLSVAVFLLLKSVPGPEALVVVPNNGHIKHVICQPNKDQSRIWAIHPFNTEDDRDFCNVWNDDASSSRNWYNDDRNDNIQYGYSNQQQHQQQDSSNDDKSNGNGYQHQQQPQPPYSNTNEHSSGYYSNNVYNNNAQYQNEGSWHNVEQQQQMNQQEGGYGDNNNYNNNFFSPTYNDNGPTFYHDQQQQNHQEYYNEQGQQQYYNTNEYDSQGYESSNDYPNEYYGSSESSENQYSMSQQQQAARDSYQYQPEPTQDENSQYSIQGNNDYHNNDRQGQYYPEGGSQERRRGGGWQVRIEERSYRPPQQAARNPSWRRRSNPILGSILDDFFWADSFFDNALDSMFMSPLDNLFSPLFSSRSRRRRNLFSTPFESMIPSTRSIAPFSRFDSSIDEKFRSMMKSSMSNNGSVIMMTTNDPTFQRRLLEQAERLLHADIACTTALGSPIQLGPVISQSSSSSVYMINGRQQQQQQQSHLQVSVRGSRRGGVIRIDATTDSGIQNLVLSVVDDGGYPREINVRLSSSDGGIRPSAGTTSSSSSSSSSSDPNIVDAEIVEKDNNSGTKPVPSKYWAATV